MGLSHVSSDSSNEMHKSQAIIGNTSQSLQGGQLSQETILRKRYSLGNQQFTSF